MMKDFPGGPVIENPPSNAGDTGSSSDQGNKVPPYYLPWGNRAHMPQRRPRAAKKKKKRVS